MQIQNLCYSHCILKIFRRKHISYVNADDVLPECLIWEIQKYIDGQIIYIPRKDENTKSWGEKNGTKDRLAERNQKIVELYYSGQTITNLCELFFLSDKTIRGIIRKYESSAKEDNGGFKDE